MKKPILVIIVLAFLLVSCNNGSSIETIPPSFSPDGLAESLSPVISENIETENLLINYPIFDKYYTENSEREWSTYFEFNYGIDININYLNKVGIDYIYDEELDGVMYLTSAPGYIYNKYIYSLINDSKLLDLSKYYDEFNWNKDIDSKYIQPISVGDKIFAVPVVSNTTIVPRYYNKQYIEELGCNIPSSINEFTEYLTATSIAYPENPPSFFNALYVSHSTADIFRGFDVYINANYESSICYNPKTNSFEDGVYSENFESALSYIRMLQENNLMTISLQPPSELPVNLVLATEFNCTYLNGMTWAGRTPEYDYVLGYYLEGTNNEKLVEARKDISFYALPIHTKNADLYMNSLSKILTSQEFSIDLEYGVEGYDYYYDGTRISDIDEKTNFYGIKQIVNSPIVKETEMNAWEFISENPDKLIYETNTYFDSFTFLKLYTNDELNKFETASKNYEVQVLMDLFNMDISMQDGIEAYKNNFDKYNIKEYIDNMNNKLNFKTSNTY